MGQYLDKDGLAEVWSKIDAKIDAKIKESGGSSSGSSTPQISVNERNTVYKENDLTTAFSDGSLYTTIANGKFENVYPGSYFNATVNNLSNQSTTMKFVVAEINRYYDTTDNTGTSKGKNHIVCIPATSFGTAAMNSSNTSNGGYLGSAMFKTTIPKVDTALTSTFGNHLLTVTLNLSNCGYAQKPYKYTATTVKSYLLTEYEAFGSNTYDDESDKTYPQLAVFKIQSSLRSTGSWWWLRSVGYGDYFCFVRGDGTAYTDYADYSYGVRPGFLIG